MASLVQDPIDRSRDHFARLVGLGHFKVRLVTVSNVILALAAVAGMGGWLLEAKRAEDAVQRYVVYVDDRFNVVGTAAVGSADAMPDGGFIKFAETWVRNLRSRSRELETLKFQRKEVILATSRELWAPLQQALMAADKEAGETAVDVQEISANLVKREGSRAVVFVRWIELARAGSAEPQVHTATLTVAYQAPRRPREMEANPLGLWAVDFQITKEMTP